MYLLLFRMANNASTVLLHVKAYKKNTACYIFFSHCILFHNFIFPVRMMENICNGKWKGVGAKEGILIHEPGTGRCVRQVCF